MLVNAPAKFTLALILAFCCTTSVSALNMSHICALTGDGAKLATTNYCNKYYICSGGLAQLQTCDSPYYFSKDKQECVPQKEVICLSDGQDPCAGHKVGTWVGVPNSCSGFYYCSDKGALRSNCPSNENFDPYTQTCKYNSNYPCGNAGTGGQQSASEPMYINLCAYIQNGIYFGNPSNCADWNLCVGNVLTSGTCTNELVFNVNLRTCDYANNWACSQVMNDPALEGPIADNGGACKSRGAMKAATSCAGYYLCDGTTYQLNKCPNNLYYDIPSQKCVNRLNARNNCDRCAGTTDSFVNQFSSTDCSGYLYCQNGVEKSKGVCKQGYFDEVAGACIVESEPKYACCNPSVDGTTAMPPIATTTEAAAAKETTVKEAATPEATTKKADTPEATTKKADTPEATTKKADTAEATTKKADTPEATTKKADTPEAKNKEDAAKKV